MCVCVYKAECVFVYFNQNKPGGPHQRRMWSRRLLSFPVGSWAFDGLEVPFQGTDTPTAVFPRECLQNLAARLRLDRVDV